MASFQVTAPDGRKFRVSAPEGSTQEQVLAFARQSWDRRQQEVQQRKAAGDSDMQRMADPTSGMGFLDKFNSGMGKAFTDIGRGASQMVGMGPSAEETQETRRLDAPLMKTGAGMAGNISGNIAALAPLALVPGANTVAGAGALGSLAGAVQPTETGGQRLMNMGVGGVLGAGVQGVAQYPNQVYEGAKGLLKKPFETAHASVEPLYEGGRKNILSRALSEATGPNRQQVTRNLRNAQELVPGSFPTAGEAGGSAGLAAMQRSAAAVDPESYATRALQQNEARVASLQDLAGTQGKRGAIEANRDAVASQLYKKARQQGVDQQMAQAMKPQVKNLMQRAPAGVVEKAKELARLNGEVMDKGGSLNGMHWMKLAIDDLLSSSKQTGIGKQTERGLVQYKDDLLSVIDELSPAYASARSTYHTMSKPINQMDIAQEIADKSINKLTGQLQPQSYARALSDDTAARATGFNKATLENTMEPSQLAGLDALKRDLARSVSARDLGRGPGSDTTQKLAMTNLLQRSGLPMGVLHTPGVSRVANWLYQNSDDQMRQTLAQTLLNPKETAAMMDRVKPYVPMGAPKQITKDRAALLGRALVLPAIPQANE